MTFTAPALAEQDRQSRAKDAAAEHSIVRHGPAAAGDGLPVPILVGGVVLAFAVGLSGGHLHRRRRLARREAIIAAPLEERPRVVTPPPAPAPEPPAPVPAEPKAVELTPPPRTEPAPEPPTASAPAPRVVEPPAAPVQPPPEPPRPEAPKAEPSGSEAAAAKPPRRKQSASQRRKQSAPQRRKQSGSQRPRKPVHPQPPGDARIDEPSRGEPPPPPQREATPSPEAPLRLVRRAPAQPPAPAAEAPLADAPELPRPHAGALPAPAIPPLAEAPEALRVPPSAEAPEPQAPTPGPGRRFGRATPWPAEADEMWTCELDWKAGYRKATFRAMAGGPGSGKRRPLGESAPVKWALKTEPEPPTPDLAIRVRGLVEALEAAGWEHIGRGRHWYEQRFLWRGSDEPQPVAVADVEAAER